MVREGKMSTRFLAEVTGWMVVLGAGGTWEQGVGGDDEFRVGSEGPMGQQGRDIQ